MQEISTKPYILRALHEWCMDNGYTPHIVVTVDDNTYVPVSHVQDGQITLNISSLATNQLNIGNEYIEFQARFNGVVEDIFVPVAAVSAIFARETGTGMGFEVTESKPYSSDESTPTTDNESNEAPQPGEPTSDSSNNKRSHLKIVK